ncbi:MULTISPECIES: hypothetical protein [unclassified Diaminobutyricimonas]|uniref:hypothetical protein n=1 Tax=unclassified Diaminobutyricimonas TaxID=2643261 RepID=UPI0012F51089|nr:MULTISPECIES: hypothetical protein [unclassified Diaminobutyricimonas]
MGEVRDITALLGFGTRGAGILLGLFIGVQGTLAMTTLDDVRSPWPTVLAFILVCAGAVLGSRPGPTPLAPRRTAFIVALAGIAPALVSWQLPTDGVFDHASWHFGAISLLLGMLCLRGRTLIAWLGFALLSAVTVGWTVSTGQGPFFGLELVSRHAGTLMVITVAGVTLRRMATLITEYTAVEQRRNAEEAATQAGLAERRASIGRLERIARPLLERIATGAALSPEEKRECGLIEATLRDAVRAYSLSSTRMDAAVLAARRRGVVVTLYDDRSDPLPTDLAEEVAAWACARLGEATSGSVVVRVLPAGRPSVATIVIDDGTPVEHRFASPASMTRA